MAAPTILPFCAGQERIKAWAPSAAIVWTSLRQLWVIWGLVHTFAGFIVMSRDTEKAVQAVADAVAPELLAMNYPDAAGGIINQHGWNLAWFGIVTIVGAVFIWRGNRTAIWVTALVGGMADLGYFLFLDLPGHVHFVPGTVMTLVSSAAIILSGWVWLKERDDGTAANSLVESNQGS